ncbi:unnamed protein product [Staurois parvus]|uniref:Eukaryotic translation initiation factor 4E binding protein 2 n=1 Tax=Staurois parvus TaxID=386267 RepID=A0ABN9HG47_9NEOB|nr:unnamed protein product [Staurois parvus]
MSAGHQHSQSRAIPTRTIHISDSSQLPHDYCTTPGGTLFSTTPGGTRIIYDRKFLLDRRNSPLAQTPPRRLPDIPGVTSPNPRVEEPKVETNNLNNHDRKTAVGKMYWRRVHMFVFCFFFCPWFSRPVTLCNALVSS